MSSVPSHETKAENIFSQMFPVPQWMRPYSAAIDISQSSIKFLTLKNEKGNVFPDVFFQIAVPEGVIRAGEIIKVEALVQLLKGISSRFGGGTVHVALPEEFAYVFPITVLNANDQEQVRTAVEFSLSEHVPLPLGQIVYDWVEIPADVSTKSRYVSVTGYDVKNSEQYREVLERAGFTVLSFEPEVHAAARACVPKDVQEYGLVLLIDIGRTRTGVTALWNGVPISTTTIDHGGSSLTSVFLEIAQNDLEKAEMLKQEQGLGIMSTHPESKEKLEACLAEWAGKINTYIEYLGETHAVAEVPLPKISRAILCGGEVAVPGIVDWIAAHVTLPVTPANVWQNMFSYENFIPEIERAVSFRLATTVGLALRNLDQ